MEKMNLLIGRILLAGVILSLILVMTGACAWLYAHGQDPAHYRFFHGEPQQLKSILDIFTDVFTFSPLALVQLGLLVLVLLQIARTAATAFEFCLSGEWGYAAISGFILAMLICSLGVFA